MGTANAFVDADGDNTVGSLEVKKNSYAIGMSFSASGATFGIGYDSGKTISAGIGYSTGQITANAFYAKRDITYMHRWFNNGAPRGDTDETGHCDSTACSMRVCPDSEWTCPTRWAHRR